MPGRYLFVALAFWTSAALAAFTEDDAVRIGREANVEGLRALVAEHNPLLIYRATSAWNFGGSRELPAPLEALVAEHYGDRAIQRSLLSLLARSIDAQNERYPKYRTRKLFDLLYVDLTAGKEAHHYAICIIATDLQVEAELTASLPQLDPAPANEIVMFLGHRKYGAAVPALQALQARIPHDKNVNQMIERVDWAYLQIGTPDAMRALYARLRTLGQMKDEKAAAEVWNILVYLNQQPPGSPPAYAELRAALPGELNDASWDQLIRLIEKRKEKAGVMELQRAITQSKRADQAVNAILAVGTPDDWRIARQEVERADKLSPGQVSSLQQRLDAAIADPAKFAEQRRQRERTEEMYRAQGDFAREKGRLNQIRKTEPKRYATEMGAVLERWEAQVANFSDVPASVGARQQIGQEYMQLAMMQRFEVRQPDDAIASYEKMRRLQPPEAGALIALYIADIQRFDKRDTRKALENYRRALNGISAGLGHSGGEARILSAFRPWIEAEIAYLERGKRFTGPVIRDDMAAGYLLLNMAAGPGLADRPVDSNALAQLTPSELQLARSFPAMLSLEPKEMLAFFEKHDPAGYLTASILSLSVEKDPSPYVKKAAETFFRSRGIQGGPLAKADPRYSTPEKTWAAFIAAEKKGDVGAMLDCMTPDIQQRFGPMFRSMTREQLKKSAESFSGFGITSSYGEFREAMVVRQQGEKKMGGIVTFVNEGGSWKIAEM